MGFDEYINGNKDVKILEFDYLSCETHFMISMPQQEL